VTRTLAEAAREAAGCTACALAAGRTQVVYGVGDPHAELMFIGEGPGFYEDKEGEPFVGRAGQLLNRMLHEIGIERADVYIANVVKCRPPNNRDPLPEEIDACKPWLAEQVDLIDPKVIATLGRFAGGFVLDRPISITRIRGQRFVVDGRVVIPTLHPAAVLRGGDAQLALLRDDFREMAKALAEPRGGASPSRAGAPVDTQADAPPPDQEQLGLF
jgi:DNA polymerase